MNDRSEAERAVVVEVEAFHDYLSAWFRGDVPRDDAEFDAKMCAHWPAEMVNIQPSGVAYPGREILEKIRDEYGSNPEFTISIHDVSVVDATTTGVRTLIVATYVERQRGAKQSTPENDRRSSVWLERESPNAIWIWRHLHETALGT